MTGTKAKKSKKAANPPEGEPALVMPILLSRERLATIRGGIPSPDYPLAVASLVAAMELEMDGYAITPESVALHCGMECEQARTALFALVELRILHGKGGG